VGVGLHSYVHQMISETWQPNALNTYSNDSSVVSLSAQQSDDRSVVVVRLSNTSPASVPVSISLNGSFQPSANVTTLSASQIDAANPPGAPTAISPVSQTMTLGNPARLSLPGYSFTVIVFSKS
jgi:alpha-L-arabinofuranosidase